MNGFHEAFDRFIFQQTTMHSHHLPSECEGYHELSNSIITMFHDIKKYLPEEQADLLFEFESNMNLLQSLSEKFMYEQGLRDGMILHRIPHGF